MKIGTQFIITMGLFGTILVVIAATAIITNQRVAEVGQQEAIAGNIAQGAGDLSYLSQDYLIYRESQQLKRWQSRFASLSTLVAGLQATRPEYQVLVSNIEANQQRLKDVFDSVASAPGGPSRDGGDIFDPAALQVSWSRMAVQTQGLISDATRLSQLLHRQMDQLTTARTLLIYAMVALFGVFLLSSYLLTYRRILKSIAALRAGTAVIGAGNLDFEIEEKKNDEIGDLSRAFNRMTSDLKAVTASKADLEREINERRQAEQALKESEAKYRNLFENITEEVHFWKLVRDAQGGIKTWQLIDANPPTLKTWGRKTLDEVKGKETDEIFGAGATEHYRPIIDKIMTEGVPYAFEDYFPNLDKYFRFTSIPLGDYFITTGADITGIKKAQKMAEQQRAQLEAVFQAMADGVVVFDMAGNVMLVNEAEARLWGYTRAEEMKRDLAGLAEVFELIDLDGRRLPVEQWPVSRVLRGESVVNRELGARRRDTHGKWFLSFSGEPVRDSQGQPILAVVIKRDITERKKAEDALRSALAEAEEARNDLEGFSYSVSHDLRAPLRAIDGFVRILLRDHGAGFDEEASRKFNVVRNNARKMGQLIDDLLQFSRVGRSELRTTRVDMTRLANEVVGEMAAVDAAGECPVRVGELPEAYADRSLIKQVMTNLISNAIKFSRGNRTAPIEIDALERSGEGIYYIKDHGVGFDMRYYDKLFGVFHRLHGEEEFEGTGVGLAIVNRIVNRHGGRIWAESQPGQGATFYFTLPKERP
jgi:PAS domain S-box-containing protein